ncbi:hypothetical protein K504DRAFT_458374 [Pleomassaria siparia CBS 279.74]|uniref:Uncharacterized protein n=1 Tax=Pleomassaria siparia CBS 279.74 TaxID=1314801 RepID=A0A6G1K686_9PLEO|nr:hypothetical protein K504DRAFT_458374 [Pleomassaria siparia CBS 279.74]
MAQRPVYEIGTTGSSIHNTNVELNVFVSDVHFRINLFTADFKGNPRLLKEYLLHVEHSDLEYIPPPLESSNNNKFVDLKKTCAPLDSSAWLKTREHQE